MEDIEMLDLRKTVLAGLLLTAATAFSGVALADDDDRSWWPRWGMQQMMMGQWGPGGMMGGWGADAMLDRIDGRLAYLKTELKITDAQTPAWDELASVIRETGAAHNDLMRDMMNQFDERGNIDKSLPERLAYHETHLAARLEQVKAVRGAVDKLYAALDDEQKKAADEIVLPMMGMGAGGRGRGFMGRW
jgi:hypothetical protein